MTDTTESKSTEDLILESARKVFVEMGPAEARMQDVADEADITQSLLHYYFRRRDDLYEVVFEQELQRFVTHQVEVLSSDRPLPDKLTTFVRRAIDFNAQNPHLAAFVAFETHYNQEHLDRLRDAASELDLGVLQEQLDARAEDGAMEPTDARHLLMHTLSLCLFPFIARPIFQSVYEMTDAEYEAFIDERKAVVPAFIAQALSS
jgi:AcrR family transcriptional regulator